MSTRTYEVRVQGLVATDDLLDALRDVEFTEQEFRTVLSGHFLDQADLFEFLRVLRSYGLEVVEIRKVPLAADQAGADGVQS